MASPSALSKRIDGNNQKDSKDAKTDDKDVAKNNGVGGGGGGGGDKNSPRRRNSKAKKVSRGDIASGILGNSELGRRLQDFFGFGSSSPPRQRGRGGGGGEDGSRRRNGSNGRNLIRRKGARWKYPIDYRGKDREGEITLPLQSAHKKPVGLATSYSGLALGILLIALISIAIVLFLCEDLRLVCTYFSVPNKERNLK